MGRLSNDILRVRPVCNICDLDLKAEDNGNGPTVFVMFIVAPILVGLAFWLEVAVAAPYWLHMVIWPALVVDGSIALLRVFKATQTALQFHNKAGEGGLNTFDPRD